ncbi:hypothetical protein BDD12DRAFT_47430 [Trichophaea hybrida]|nr:hypothetical protein BDD12DRAFT_47430 [Trichophaea hybrida]
MSERKKERHIETQEKRQELGVGLDSCLSTASTCIRMSILCVIVPAESLPSMHQYIHHPTPRIQPAAHMPDTPFLFLNQPPVIGTVRADSCRRISSRLITRMQSCDVLLSCPDFSLLARKTRKEGSDVYISGVWLINVVYGPSLVKLAINKKLYQQIPLTLHQSLRWLRGKARH